MNIPPYETERNQQSLSDLGRSRDFVIPKKTIIGGLILVLLLVALFSGLLNRGYESKTIRFSKGSRISHGTSFGSKRVLLREGQTFTADYEVQIETGGLSIRLEKFLAPSTGTSTGQVRIRQSASSQLRIPISETGVYKLWVQGIPDKDGYHVSYTLTWKTE
jgi:hypothetical protein